MATAHRTSGGVASVILHPLFIISLAVLLTNDHIFKTHFPSWLTGKLSDFAGLCVFVALLFAILRRQITTERSLALLHSAVGLLFIVWKLAPVEGLLAFISSVIDPLAVGRTRDASDLLALIVLPLCYIVLRPAVMDRAGPQSGASQRRLATALWLTVACFAVVATTILPPYTVREERPLPRGSAPEAEILFRTEQTLAHQGVHVLSRRAVTERTYTYWIVLDTVVTCGPDNGKLKERGFRLDGSITLDMTNPEVLRVVASVNFDGRVRYGDEWKRSIIDSIFAVRIARPVLEELAR
jgi:hypothetical protein